MELKIVTNSDFMQDFMDVIRAFSPMVEYAEKEEINVIHLEIENEFVRLKFKEKTIENRGQIENLPQI